MKRRYRHHDECTLAAAAPFNFACCSSASDFASRLATAYGPLCGRPFISFASEVIGDPSMSAFCVFDLLGLNGTGVEGRDDRN